MAYRSTNGPDWQNNDPNLDDLVQDAVRVGSHIGSSILGGISSVLDQVEEHLETIRSGPAEQTFPEWKRRLDRKLQNGRQSESLALAITGWTFAVLFGVAAIVMFALSAAGPQVLGIAQGEFLVFPILMACFTPLTVGFSIMGATGVHKYRYFSRLRRYLRVARDWVSDVTSLARDSASNPAQLRADLAQAVARGDFPDALLQQEQTFYWDLSRCAPQKTAEEPEQTEPFPQDDLSCFQQEGQAFLAYLEGTASHLDRETAAELEKMRQTCKAILEFVNGHPQQLPRIRRLREYYLPTTRKLLDTAQGLGDSGLQHAAEIRRDITGIMHTLNQAYEKLYDTLLEDVSLDVSTEIDTLETMLRQDGLTHDFKTDFRQE